MGNINFIFKRIEPHYIEHLQRTSRLVYQTNFNGRLYRVAFEGDTLRTIQFLKGDERESFIVAQLHNLVLSDLSIEVD